MIKTRPLLFLDFDDVICLAPPHIAFHLIDAQNKIQKKQKTVQDLKSLWIYLFDDRAKFYLEAINDEFNPVYVLTTSWTRYFDKESLIYILNQAGLKYVTENLHQSWCTLKKMSMYSRATEIMFWNELHAEYNNSWVILDDEKSGSGLNEWHVEDEMPFIITCKADIGLTHNEYELLRNAFIKRINA